MIGMKWLSTIAGNLEVPVRGLRLLEAEVPTVGIVSALGTRTVLLRARARCSDHLKGDKQAPRPMTRAVRNLPLWAPPWAMPNSERGHVVCSRPRSTRHLGCELIKRCTSYSVSLLFSFLLRAFKSERGTTGKNIYIFPQLS